MNEKYGITEVFVKQDYYAGLRIKLFRQNEDGTQTLLEYSGDKLKDIKPIKVSKKIYELKKGFLSFKVDSNIKYFYEDGEYSFPRYKYIMHEGSSRSSKSFSIEEWILRYCENNPNTRVTVWRDTKESLATTIWKDFRKISVLSGRNLSFTKHTTPIYVGDGSIIEPHQADATNAHGVTQDIAWLNEPYKVTKEAFNQISMRSEQVILDLNPKQKHWADILKNHPRCITIHSTFINNPFCPPEQKLTILGYDPNNPVNVENGTADPYMHDVYALGKQAEKPNKVFKNWQKITLHEFMLIDSDIYYGVDWGMVHPMGIVEVKYYDGTFYVNELSYKSENDLIAELIKLYGHDYQNELQMQGLGVVTWHMKRLGIDKRKMCVCDSAKPDKIMEMANAGYNVTPAHKPKGSVFSGISNMQRANIKYTDTSINFHNEFMNYEWNTDRYGLITEEPIKRDDDLIDPTRYVISWLCAFLRIEL